MCTVVHLEPEDFARELVHNQKNVQFQRKEGMASFPPLNINQSRNR